MYQNSRYQPVKRASSQKGWLAIAALIVIVLVAAGAFVVFGKNKNAPGNTGESEQTAAFDKSRFSLTDPTSPWLVVNKQRQLDPKEYEPSDLRTPNMDVESVTMLVNNQTATALEALNTAAKNEGIGLIVASAYRSYDDQAGIYQSMVNGYGQAEADRQSARPGHSEHQTGWAVDLNSANNDDCRLETCFADTREGKWLAANAYKYGFIIRYPDGKESVTGYAYEPWHLRYVGTELSQEMHRTNTLTLEEFFSLPAAPTY